MQRALRNLVFALLLSGAAGCATNGTDPRDPLEGFNRAMYSFNDDFDTAIGKPVATAYRDVLPGPVREWVRNFFANIGDLWIGVNNLMQGKPADAVTDWARFAFNSTLGVFGINDVASDMGLDKHAEDFGQTMGRWGIGDGAYLVWPILGSSTVRDTVGLIPDYAADSIWNYKPHGVRYFMAVLRVTGRRADLLDASRILEEAALDKYVFQRDAHLQRRRNLVHDGNPPRAAREIPRAEATEPEREAAAEPEPAVRPVSESQPALQPVSEAPVATPDAAAMETAVRLLEQPASPAASAGG